jgi:hypothetical protein
MGAISSYPFAGCWIFLSGMRAQSRSGCGEHGSSMWSEVGVAEMCSIVEGNGKAAGVAGGGGEGSQLGSIEEASTSTLFDNLKYSSLWGIAMRSTTTPESWMEDVETDEGCWYRDGRGTLAGWWMTLPFRFSFVKCRMRFRKGTESLLNRVSKNPRLRFGGEGRSCHFE